MTRFFNASAAAVAIGLGIAALPGSASSLPVDSSLTAAPAVQTDIQQVRWRGGRGWGVGAGFLGGAIVGSALASPYYGYGPYYGPGPYYYGPGPYYNGAPGPAYGGDAVSYCMQRFRSYNPNTGTYMGYDGRPHPCP